MIPENKTSLWTRFIIVYRNHIRPVLDEYRYPILFLAWILVFILGYIGYSQLNLNETVLNRIYLTLHLFYLGETYQGPLIPLLDIARVLAPLLVYISLISLLADKFYYHLEIFRLRLFARNHIVVCGLGYVGSIIVRNHLSTKSVPIVVIERDPAHKDVEWCKRYGISVVTGDAADRRTLEQARVISAQSMYLATGDDEINAKVVARVHEIVQERKDPLICHIHIDPNFTNLLRVPQLALSSISSIHLEFFNIYQIASFCILECLPDLIPLKGIPPERHILIIGLTGNYLDMFFQQTFLKETKKTDQYT